MRAGGIFRDSDPITCEGADLHEQLRPESRGEHRMGRAGGGGHCWRRRFAGAAYPGGDCPEMAGVKLSDDPF
eukprot:1178483-Prorocentrum_minimum.AAC.1